MRFLARSLIGLSLAALTLGLLILGAGTLRNAVSDRESAAGGRPAGAERIYTVRTDVLVPETVRPVLTAYGDVESGRQLELRAGAAGRLLSLAPDFVDGGDVIAGEVLWQIDPAPFETALAISGTDLAAAEAEAAEAEAALELAYAEVSAAERARDLRIAALDRRQDLDTRGVGTAADLDEAELALAAAEQALIGRRAALAAAEARTGQAEIALERAQLSRTEAARTLAETTRRAPFDGLIAEPAAIPGRLVSLNERLGLLVDDGKLEISIQLSRTEYARLSAPDGSVREDIAIAVEPGGGAPGLPARLVRVGAATAAGSAGRRVYARLEADPNGALRPGDFVTVRITEPPLEEVARLPASAITADGRILVVGPDERLEEIPVTVLRREGDTVVAGDLPFGRAYVTARLPELGPGLRVRPIPDGGEEAAGGAALRIRAASETGTPPAPGGG